MAVLEEINFNQAYAILLLLKRWETRQLNLE